MSKNETLEKLFPTVMKIKNKGKKDEKEEPIDTIPIQEEENIEDTMETDEYGDAVTEVLTSTSKEILTQDVLPMSKDYVSTIPKDDMEREMCRLGNMRKVVLDAISQKGVKPALRGSYVAKLKTIDDNMSLLAKYMSKS